MHLLRKITDLLFYSNLYIAIAATLMLHQTLLLQYNLTSLLPISGLVFCATLFLYAVHRIVGIQQLSEFQDSGRYEVIHKFRTHIIFYAVVSMLGGIYFFFQLRWATQILLVAFAVISLGYAIPFLGNKKLRLRDIAFTKIFLVAIVWAGVTVALPAFELQKGWHPSLTWMMLERAFFIFAITLPFDIRDLKVDEHSEVKTIPAFLGIQKTKLLSLFLLGCCFGFSFANFQLGTYTNGTLIALGISFATTYLLIHFATPERDDYFYTGLLDGTMILQFFLVWGLL